MSGVYLTRLGLLHLLYDIKIIWRKTIKHASSMFSLLYDNQINARALIGQSAAMVYCAGKLMEISRVFSLII